MEYIDREALLQEIQRQKEASRTSYPKQHFVVGDVLTCIYLAPSADVAPVVRGRWIFNDDWWEFRCTNCHKSIGNIEKYKYCPHCGARMDGTEENG